MCFILQISGVQLKNAIISGTNNILNNKNMVDELNVFPVPDGDTGTNMSMTIKNAMPELKVLPDDVTVSAVADATASAMLRGARGNSGVILSLLFRGLSKGFKEKTTVDGTDFAAALEIGVKSAYKSVMKPTEGTILTVARETSEAVSARAKENNDIAELLTLAVEAAKKSLDNTPELLPVLKKAGVVDAGGMGFYVILQGMKSSIVDGIEIVNEADAPKTVVTNIAEESVPQLTYCAEFVVLKKADSKDASLLRAYLETIGDSVVVVDDTDFIKVHLHTEHPGKALEEGILFGSLTNLKIENLKEEQKKHEQKIEMVKSNKLAPAAPENEYGFVAVASGAGVEAIFKDLGVDSIVRGGQTSNPSTEDILEAILATPAKNIFVLPNNKNIIMAAEQATKLVSDRKVFVLQSRTIPQGITAMMSFNPDAKPNENSVEMTKALDRVGTGSITYAVRDSDFEGKNIKQGDILAMENGKLAVVERDITKALIKITKRLMTSESSYITLIYGADVSEDDANEAYEALKAKLGDDVEIVLVDGGQPVYYYIISVE